MIDMRICRKIYRRQTRYTPGTFGIYLFLILLCKKIDIYSFFFRIKSLRAYWIVLQRWAWGRQRGVAFSLFLVPFSFLFPLLPEQTVWKSPRLKKTEKKKIDYPTTQSIQKSARFSFRVVWFVHAPVTHPTLQPLHGKHCFFIYFNIFSFLYFRLFFVAFSVVTRSLRRNARIIFPCAHATFFLQIDFVK